MTEQEFQVGWKMLMANPWPKPPPDGARALFCGVVSGLVPEAWGEAVQAVLRKCTHFPTVKELLEHIPGAPQCDDTEAQAAWERACHSSRHGPRGPYSPVMGSPPTGADLDGRTRAAAKAVGLRRIEGALVGHNPDTAGYLRREFLDAWRAHRDADRAGVLTPAQQRERKALEAPEEQRTLPPAMSDAERKANAQKLVDALKDAIGAAPPPQERKPMREQAVPAGDGVPAEVRAADREQARLTQRERFDMWQREFEARQAAAEGEAA